MAHCPKCNENWFWDWDQDTYRYVDGSIVENIELFTNEDNSSILIFKCKCNAINSAAYLNPKIGMILYSIKEWQNIDWEKDSHCWDLKCKNCKTLECINDKKDFCKNINCLYEDIEG